MHARRANTCTRTDKSSVAIAPRQGRGKARADLPALVRGAVDLALVVVGADDPGSTPRVSDVRTAALTVQRERVN
jgi:hypothetical protein